MNAKGKIRLVYLLLLILTLSAFILRLYGFYQPHRYTFDEGLFVQLGLQLSKNITNYTALPLYQEAVKRGRNMNHCQYLSAPLFKHPPLFSYLTAAFFKINAAALKTAKDFFQTAALVPAISGSLTVILVFFIGKYSFDWRVGLLAALFLTLDPIHWVSSEKIWIESTLGFFTTLALLFFILGRKNKIYFLLSGLSIGWAFLSKYPGVLALLSLATFALIWERNLLKLKEFRAFIILPFLVSLPWLLWNFQVYRGRHLFKNIIGIHRLSDYLPYLSGFVGKLICLGVFLIFLFMAAAYRFAGLKIKGNFKKWLGLSLSVFLIGGLGFLAVKNFLLYFSFTHIPQTGWRIGTFVNQPWYFYFGRLLELSGVYLFSFLGWLLLAEGKNEDRLFFVWCFFLFAFFISWGNFQSRYLISAVPVLLLTASRLIIWLFDYFKERRLIQFLILSLVVFFLIKTIFIDLYLPLSNNFAYF